MAGLGHHVDLDNGHWQFGAESERSSDASFVSAKFHSFEDGGRDMFYDNLSQAAADSAYGGRC